LLTQEMVRKGGMLLEKESSRVQVDPPLTVS